MNALSSETINKKLLKMEKETNTPGTELRATKKRGQARGLGRGLDALFGDEEATFSSSENVTETEEGTFTRKIVSIAHVHPNPDQPRRHYDEQALEELASSIERHGLLQPLIVRPDDETGESYQIVAGERRWRASQKARLHEVPVIVTDYDEQTVIEIALVENLQREDLNPVEEAEGYSRLVQFYGHTQDEIAKTVGKSRSHVANTLRLLNLPEPIKNLVIDGKLSSGHARALITSENPEELAEEIISKGLNVRETEALTGKASGKRKNSSSCKKSSGQQKDADTRALEDEVSQALGMQVSIEMKSGHAGSLSIDFQNLDQLDEILHRLSHYPGARLHG